MTTSEGLSRRRIAQAFHAGAAAALAASLAGCTLFGDGVPPGEPPSDGIVAAVSAKKRSFKDKKDAVNYMLASYVTRCPQFAAAPEPPALFTQFKKGPGTSDDAPDILVGKFARMGLVRVVDSRAQAKYILLSEFAEIRPAFNPEVDEVLAADPKAERCAHVKWTVSLLDAPSGTLLWYDNATFAVNPDPIHPKEAAP